MPDDRKKSKTDFRVDYYGLIRCDTEHIVQELLAVMRDRRDESIDRYLRDNRTGAKTRVRTAISETESAKLEEIMLSHSTGFAHALLEGALEAFDDREVGLKLLKELIDVELAEVEQDATFRSRATSAGSFAIN